MASTPTQSLPSTAAELSGPMKAAILLLSLDHDVAGQLLAHFPPEMVQEVTRLVATLNEVPAGLATEVVEEFYGRKAGGIGPRTGGIEYASSLLKGAMEPSDADSAIEKLQSQVPRTPFAFLKHAAAESVLTFIQDEHPQTIALVLSHLAHNKSSEILSGLAPEKQIEVVRRMAHMEQTNPDVIKDVELGLASRLSSLVVPTMDGVGGVEAVAEVLNLCDRTTEKTIMEGIETEDPDLVEQIRRLMFVFEDILNVDDKGIQSVLKEVDNDELCLSLKTASDELKEKIFTNMSSRASEMIQEEMQYLGPVRLSDVEAAQQRIVDIVRRLEDAGEIIVQGRGGEGDAIV